jgi:hypothetical protein
MGFSQLRRYDSWGSIVLHDGPAPEKPGQRFQCPAGTRVRVRMPDGLECDLPVVLRTERHRVGDMGHDYDVDSKVPGVVLDCHGLFLWVPLDQQGLLVWNDCVAPSTRRGC